MADTQKTTAFTVSSDDAALALRMGWMVAELRGRLDPDCMHQPQPAPDPPTLLLDAANERSPVESQIEATKVVSSIGKNALVKVDIKSLSRADKWGGIPSVMPAVQDVSDLLRYLVCRLINARLLAQRASTGDTDLQPDVHQTLATAEVEAGESTDPAHWWEYIEWLFWAWDEALQDQLASGNFGTSSAYQLGRGLSETYWAMLPPKTLQEYEAPWSFLLGSNRVQAFSELLRRLGPVFSDYTATAVEFSVTAWGEVARAPAAYDRSDLAIAHQVSVWRDLLVTGRDPLTLVEPKKFETVARNPWPIIKAFSVEILVALGLAVLFGFAIADWGGTTKTVLAALATVGISASAIVSWIKGRAQTVAAHVGTAVNQSVVNDAVAVLPKPIKATGVRGVVDRVRLPLDAPPAARRAAR